jgi:hypothetical protein
MTIFPGCTLQREGRRIWGSYACAFLAILLLRVNCYADDLSAQSRHFTLNEDMIRETNTPSDSDACNPASVLRDLLRQIAPTATVYPTENYYYFGFFRGGNSYSGSLHFSVDNRDNGIVEFACYRAFTSWLEPHIHDVVMKYLSKDDGVSVIRIHKFVYDVEFQGTKVRFLLNKINQTADDDILSNGDEFVGRLCDDSGIMFDLVYNRPQKAFYFILDPQIKVNETLVKIENNVYIGSRTGFVYFDDIDVHRYILVAVNRDEVHNNSPYDGPFDQLPENYYDDIDFWSYVYDARPDLVGKLTNGGVYLNRDPVVIFGLAPYQQYKSLTDLEFVDECTNKFQDHAKRVLCLTRGWAPL